VARIIYDFKNVFYIYSKKACKTNIEVMWLIAKKLPIEVQNIGHIKLRMINNSQDITDLRISPSNRLEK
jgi:plasmid maintenance system killer protein